MNISYALIQKHSSLFSLTRAVRVGSKVTFIYSMVMQKLIMLIYQRKVHG